jgi:site-specific DNA-methyltransferase (adenine-specific)
MSESTTKLSEVKGRPMLRWVGKEPLTHIKSFPTQLIETFSASGNAQPIYIPTYDALKDNWKNQIYHGDCKEIMGSMLANGYRGKIDLAYWDSPFDSAADYIRKVKLRGTKNIELTGEEYSIGEQIQYHDIWKNDEFYQFIYERAILQRELLRNTGSLYVHLDHHQAHYVKIILDEVFSKENFRNEIVWCYTGPSRTNKDFPNKHDIIFRYTKTENYVFNFEKIRIPYVKRDTGKTKGIFKERKMLDESGKVPEDWWSDITPVARLHATELTDYPTQKPRALLERIIKASSNKGDLIFEPFAGSAPASIVAQKLGRRWIACDINKGSIQTISKEMQKIIKQQGSA